MRGRETVRLFNVFVAIRHRRPRRNRCLSAFLAQAGELESLKREKPRENPSRRYVAEGYVSSIGSGQARFNACDSGSKRTRMNRNCCPGHAPQPLSRREMLRASALGFGSLALTGMLAEAQANTLPPGPSTGGRGEATGTHHRPRARNVIFCFMDGGVSHVDSFDPKPELARRDNQPYLDSRNPTAAVVAIALAEAPWAFLPARRSARHDQRSVPTSRRARRARLTTSSTQ